MQAGKEVGDRVGPYELVDVLGTGGAGKVFKAAWRPTEEQRADAPPDHPDYVALKLLRPEYATNEAVFNRFVREIGVAQTIDHPHILKHVDSGITDDYLFYAMEVAAYGSLREVLNRRQSLPWRDAVEGAIHIAEALAALHDRGVVHRDLKPANVFLAEDGRLKLGDFGLSLREDADRLTVAGQTVGTVRYMAPEQVRGQRDLDGRTDLYALGCLITEMVAGRPPFTGGDAIECFRQHVKDIAPKLRSLAPAAPAALERLVDRLLEKGRNARPPHAQAVAKALRAILAAPDGEAAGLDDSLVGEPAAIEPLPDEDDDSSAISLPAMSAYVDDSDDESRADLPALGEAEPTPSSESLSHRLAGPNQKRGGCLGVLVLVCGMAAVVVGLVLSRGV